MNTQPERTIVHTQDICFPNGNCAQSVFLSRDTNPLDALPVLNIPSPDMVIMIVGGAARMDVQAYPNLASLFTNGIAHLAASLHALTIDGGTQAGVMEMMGTGVAKQHRPSTLLGVAPAGAVIYPGQATPSKSEDVTPLDPNHSHFVFVETDEWGGETETMYEIAQFFSHRCPSIAIVINGGTIAQHEVLYNVRQKRPLLILEGSGRMADDIALLWKEKSSTIADPELAEIIQHGDIHLFPITGHETAFEQYAQYVLGKR